jgi:MFS family permease
MMTTERPRRLLALHDESPTGARAFAFAALWLLVAAGVAAGAFAVVLDAELAPLLRLLFVLLIMLPAVLALMLASDSIERGVSESFRGWAGRVYWLTTSIAVLAAVIVGGAAATLLIPGQPGLLQVGIDLIVDLLLGGVAGALTVGALMLVGRSFGEAIYRFQRQFGSEQRAARWKPTSTAKQCAGGTQRQLLRGAVIGAAGLLLSVVYTAIITTATTNHSGAAEAPTQVLKSPWSTILAPLVAWFLGTGVAWLWFARDHRRNGKQGPIAVHHGLRHSTHGTALAVGLLILGGWLTARTLEHRAERRLWSGPLQHVPALPATPAQWKSQSPDLAQRFEPRFWLTRDERWSPTSVSWYLANSDTTKTAPFCQTGEGCHELDIPKLSCDGASPPAGCAPSGTAEPGLYYRYCEASECGREAPHAPGVSWKVVQYWIFYNYDSLQAGMVTQWHQADWEQVSVLLRRTDNIVRPVEVAFSEHCYGARLPAERVRWEGTHPISYVGKGSHANYPRPVSLPVRQLRCALGLTPRYFGVAGLFFEPAFDGTSIELPLAYTIGLRDRAERARPVPPLPLLPLAATPAVNGFKGAWGRDNDLALLEFGRLATGAGPPAPQVQGPWDRPFPAMFCSHSWLSIAPHEHSATSWVCPPA